MEHPASARVSAIEGGPAQNWSRTRRRGLVEVPGLPAAAAWPVHGIAIPDHRAILEHVVRGAAQKPGNGTGREHIPREASFVIHHVHLFHPRRVHQQGLLVQLEEAYMRPNGVGRQPALPVPLELVVQGSPGVERFSVRVEVGERAGRIEQRPRDACE